VSADTADSADTNPARFSSLLVSRACENFAIFGNLVSLPVMAAGPKNALADTADSADTKPCRPSPPATEYICCFRHRKREEARSRINDMADTADSADTIWAKPVHKNGADVVE
jgi:hypothetical protein